MKRLILLTALSFPAHADEAGCLSKILYAEARGAALEGTMIVGECTLTRAVKQSRSICAVTGVKRRSPPAALTLYYASLSKTLIANPTTRLSKGCDSWNRGTRPHLKGKVTRHADGQVFYVMK
jgi:hypothetical protein